jgi:hypothetical protein
MIVQSASGFRPCPNSAFEKRRSFYFGATIPKSEERSLVAELARDDKRKEEQYSLNDVIG